MVRTMLIATAVVVVAALAYFAILGAEEPTLTAADTPVAQDVPIAAEGIGAGAETNEAIAQENMSNRAASDAATDEAFQSALDGEEPVQNNLDASRAAADATGAVGAAAFTPEGFDRVIVVTAIEDSDLEQQEKDELMALLARIEPAGGDLEPALAQIRAALELEY